MRPKFSCVCSSHDLCACAQLRWNIDSKQTFSMSQMCVSGVQKYLTVVDFLQELKYSAFLDLLLVLSTHKTQLDIGRNIQSK